MWDLPRPGLEPVFPALAGRFSATAPPGKPIYVFLIKKNFIHLFIYFWLRWVFIAARGLSSCGERGLLFIAVHGLLIVMASLVAEHGF